MAQLVVSSLAQDDTRFVVLDLARKAGFEIANQYVESFERLYRRLAQYPDSGAPRPAIGENIRIGVVRPYLVIYEYDAASETVMILRIVHGRRRITGQMLLTDF